MPSTTQQDRFEGITTRALIIKMIILLQNESPSDEVALIIGSLNNRVMESRDFEVYEGLRSMQHEEELLEPEDAQSYIDFLSRFHTDAPDLSSREERHFAERQRGRERRDRDEARHSNQLKIVAMIEAIENQNVSLDPPHRFTTICGHCNQGINENRREYSFTPLPGSSHLICCRCINQYQYCDATQELTERIRLKRTTKQRKVSPRFIKKTGLKQCHGCALFIEEGPIKGIKGRYYCKECNDINKTTMKSDNKVLDKILSEDDPKDLSSFGDYPEWREYSTKKHEKFCSDNTGSIMKSSRVFACELETMYPNGQTYNKIMRKFAPKELGATSDGTITRNGAEFQTPKLGGSLGEEFIKDLSKILVHFKFTTDKTCGLHIHFDGGSGFVPTDGSATDSYPSTKLRNLFLMYLVFEDVIHSFLPRSRRANTYCRPMKNGFHMNEVLNASTVEEIEKIWYRRDNKSQISEAKSQKKNGTRYSGINFHTLLSENHLEVRYHSGTVNARKILEWANLHANIMDRISEGMDYAQINMAFEILDIKEKTDYFLKLIKLSPSSKRYFLKRQEKFMIGGDIKEESWEPENE